MVFDFLASLSQSTQTSILTVELVVHGYVVLKLSDWMGDDTPDEPRLQCEICGREATVSGDGEHEPVSCLGPPGDRHEETEMELTDPR